MVKKKEKFKGIRDDIYFGIFLIQYNVRYIYMQGIILGMYDMYVLKFYVVIIIVINVLKLIFIQYKEFLCLRILSYFLE